MSKKYEAAAAEILAAIGGAENVNAARHCQTRLRFALKDQGKVDRETLEAIPAVLKVIPTEGMYQVVIGTDVASCYEEIVKLLPESIGQAGDAEDGPKQKVSPVTAVVDFISGSFQPVIPALSGAGMLKALMALLVVFHVIDPSKASFSRSLERLGTDYVDLYLIHMPFGDYYGSWRAMEELYVQGKVRAIGVSNFDPARLLDLCKNAKVLPTVNQLETHPFCQQGEAIEAMRALRIQPEAWSPFAEGKQGIFQNPILTAIGKTYGKSAAQVILRWHIQRDAVVIPKSVHTERIRENFDIWDFTLSQKDMEQIATLDQAHGLMLDITSTSEVQRLYGIRTVNG